MNRIVILFLLNLIVPSTYAQFGDTSELFLWEVKPDSEQIEQGVTSNITAKLTVAKDHIIYKDMTKITVSAPDGIDLADPQYANSVVKFDPTIQEEKDVFVGETEHTIPFYVQQDTQPGDYIVSVTVEYQGCSQSVCYFPETKQYEVPVTVITNTSGFADVNADEFNYDAVKANSLTGETNNPDNFFSKGYFWTFLTVFGFGVLTCFTPCVYPLIPITVTIFGARESKSKLQAFTLALTYVIGIAVMYSTLGYAAAKTGAVFGQFMSNPWVIGFIVSVFAAMGASMLGAFELQLPSSWTMKLTQMGGKGYGSAFFMGLVAGIIAAPCTGPVLVGVLTYVATSGNTFLGVSLLMTYAFGLGMLFLIIGTFSGFISKLPKSGGWMENVKSVFGILLFAFALYYLKEAVDVLKLPLDHSTITYVIATVLFIVGAGIGAIHLSYHTKNFTVRARKTVGVIACTFALYLGMGSMTAVRADNIDWLHSIEEGLELAKTENKPVMIDFYADWCSVCKEIEAFTFATDEVGEELERFVSIKIDLTDETPENQKIMKLFDIRGLPHLTFFDSSGKRLDEKRQLEFISKDEFLEHVSDIK